MSKISLPLTEKHNDQIGKQINEWVSSYSQPSMTYYEYCEANPLILEFDIPSPWRTDFENAPRDGTNFLVWVFGSPRTIHAIDEEIWFSPEDHKLDEMVIKHITHWMGIAPNPDDE